MPFKNQHYLYSTWKSMRRRCNSPSSPSFKNYGGRGIAVCEKWNASFHAFVEDMGERPPGYSIERIDVNGDYEPSNCKWIPRNHQSRNTRRSRIFEFNGVPYALWDLTKASGLKPDTVKERIERGLALDEVIDRERIKKPPSPELIERAWRNSAHKRRQQTHCKRGHEFTVENTYLSKEGYRVCRACHAAKTSRQRREKRYVERHKPR